MNRAVFIIALAAVALVAAVLLLRPARIPDPRPAPVIQDDPPEKLPDLPDPPPDRKKNYSTVAAFLDRLGRALVTGDTRTVESLTRSFPTIYRDDIEWILEQIEGGLFRSAGAAEVCLRFDITKAIRVIEARLPSGSVFLKDQLVRVLALFEGDGVGVLVTYFSREAEASVRVKIIHGLAPQAGTSDAVRQLLIDALKDPSPEVRKAAARYVESSDLLAAILLEQDVRVRTDLIRSAWRDKSARDRIRELVRSDPEALEELIAQDRLHNEARYAATYPLNFFDAAQPSIPWDPTRTERIGITINVADAGDLSLSDAIRLIFTRSPFDRYASFFYVRDAEVLEKDLAAAHPSPAAWDAGGSRITGGLPMGEQESTVYLRFRDPSKFGGKILGYTEGTEANVTEVSLLHELGHAFARLADEYDSELASDAGGSNVESLDASPVKWDPLVKQGHLPKGEYTRTNRRIPSPHCHMNNHPTDNRFCAVCQLQIIATICEKTGAFPPW